MATPKWVSDEELRGGPLSQTPQVQAQAAQGPAPVIPAGAPGVVTQATNMATTKAMGAGMDKASGWAGEQLLGRAGTGTSSATQGVLGMGGSFAPSAGTLMGSNMAASTAAATDMALGGVGGSAASAGAGGAMAGMGAIAAAAPWLAAGYLGGKLFKLWKHGTTNVGGSPFGKNPYQYQQYQQPQKTPLEGSPQHSSGGPIGGTGIPNINSRLKRRGGEL